MSGVFASAPPLDGELLVDASSRDAAGRDFGNVVFERPAAVLRPGSVADISRMLDFARANGLRVVGRGAAHSMFGQSQHAAGITFDLTTFNDIGQITDGSMGKTLTIGAGCRWRHVVNSAARHGYTPTVLPDYLGQTVGGSLAVGGVGAASFRYGAQVDHVTRLRAVTGNGDVVDCSLEQHRELFEMLLAGQGQVGVIVEATIGVMPIPSAVRFYSLEYPGHDAVIDDLLRFVGDDRFDQAESFSLRNADGSFRHVMHAAAYHDGVVAPDDRSRLACLGNTPGATTVQDMSYARWAHRVNDRTVRPNPWIDLILPASAATEFVAEVMATMAPPVVGEDCSLLLLPLRNSLFSRPLLRTASEELSIGFDALRALPAGTDLAPVLDFNRRLYERCVELGGAVYPVGAVRLEAADWRRHYGDEFDRLVAAKRRFDTDGLLASGPDILHRVDLGADRVDLRHDPSPDRGLRGR